MDFEHEGRRYQIHYLPGARRIQAWSKPINDTRWQQGESKEVPVGLSARVASEVMRRYIVGEIDRETYNATLPGK